MYLLCFICSSKQEKLFQISQFRLGLFDYLFQNFKVSPSSSTGNASLHATSNLASVWSHCRLLGRHNARRNRSRASSKHEAVHQTDSHVYECVFMIFQIIRCVQQREPTISGIYSAPLSSDSSSSKCLGNSAFIIGTAFCTFGPLDL